MEKNTRIIWLQKEYTNVLKIKSSFSFEDEVNIDMFIYKIKSSLSEDLGLEYQYEEIRLDWSKIDQSASPIKGKFNSKICFWYFILRCRSFIYIFFK